MKSPVIPEPVTDWKYLGTEPHEAAAGATPQVSVGTCPSRTKGDTIAGLCYAVGRLFSPSVSLSCSDQSVRFDSHRSSAHRMQFP